MAETSEHKESEAQEVAEEVVAVAREYSSQADYISGVSASAEKREREVTDAIRAAFGAAIRLDELEVIDFQAMNARELAAALESYPIVLKPLLAASNLAGRAIERDLELRNINTYIPRLSASQAASVAGYLKAFLPLSLPVRALIHIDRISFIDKEVRAQKGRWEKAVNRALTRFSGYPFRKFKFRVGSDLYELDCAHIEEGQVVYGVDVKRIEARRDIHKRSDEIANKAARLKRLRPEAKFGAVNYYPFPAEHGNIRDRLESPFIDSVQFAGEQEASINQAVRLLLAKFGLPRDVETA